jgi:glycosyltransferase involved in cell wall biosynthesis
MEYPLVSIIICCHNRRHYLEQTMQSVFAQKYRPVEIIVMDDGSTDGTAELLAGYGDRIRHYRQDKQGIAVARTNASRLAQGPLIAYQDDDDLMPPDRITRLYEALLQFPQAVFATGDYATIDAEGELTGQRWLPGKLDERAPPVLVEDGHTAILWPRIPAVPHTTLIKTSFGARIGWFDHAFRYACSDADFLARLAQLGPIVYLREVVSYYRRGHSAIWNDDLRANVSRLQLWEKHLRLSGPDQSALRRRLKARMSQSLRRIALCESQGLKMEDPAARAYINAGQAAIGASARLALKWYTAVQLPLRNLVRSRVSAPTI